jgi:hypothetical protein
MGVAAVMPKKRGPKPNPEGSRDMLIALKCSEAYKSWAERGADYLRTDVSKLVDAALVHYLDSVGFPEKPPRR